MIGSPRVHDAAVERSVAKEKKKLGKGEK